VKTVLLTDPEQRATLAAARSLAKAGYRVVTAGYSRGIAGVSKSVTEHVALDPDGTREDTVFVQAVLDIARRVQADVIVPITDVASRALLMQRSTFPMPVAGPSADAYARASDKATLLALSATLDIRVPRQAVATGPITEERELSQLPFPLAMKPSSTVSFVDGVARKLTVNYAADTAAVRSVFDRLPPSAYPLLLQERIFGEGIGVFLYRRHQRTLCQFSHRRIREKPPSGGVSTYRESVAVDPPVLAQCERLLDALAYEGAAMIEFKRDLATGELVLMEINARLWGSLQLAVDAGVDFPRLLVADALGDPLPSMTAPRIGVRTYWELGELDHALAIARKSRQALGVPADFAIGAGAALRALLDRRRADRAEVFRFSDPAPFLEELRVWLSGH
jgi:predicted ATP-grasp superfamily ATP-dependent carboligase